MRSTKSWVSKCTTNTEVIHYEILSVNRPGGGYRSNGVVLTSETSLPEQKLLHGRYLLLQRGRKSHHLVEVFS